MGIIDEAWKGTMETVGGELDSCFSGGCDPGTILNKELRRGSRSLARGFGEEFRVSSDHLFNSHIDPLVDEINIMARDRIDQGAEHALDIVQQTSNEIDEIRVALRGDIEDLLENVDIRFKEAVKIVFDNISQALTRAIVATRIVINDIDRLLEARLKELAKIVMSAMVAADAIVGRIFSELNALENRLVRDLNSLYDRFDKTILGTQAWADLLRQRIADYPVTSVGLFTMNRQLKICYEETEVPLQTGPSLAEDEIYVLTRCMRLKEIERDIEEDSVDAILRNYAFLQGQAWDWLTMNRGAESEEHRYARDYLRFGAKYDLWTPYG